MSNSSTNLLSISNDSGALISKFIPPNVGNRFYRLYKFVNILKVYFYIKTSMSANILKITLSLP
jgi:hypothetical protein